MSNSKLIPAALAAVFVAGGVVPLYMAHAAKPKTTEAASATSTATPTGNALARKAAYSIGFLMANGNKQQIPDLDVGSFTDGFKTAYSGKESKYSEDEMNSALMAFKEQTEKDMAEKAKAASTTNLDAGKKFLAENAKKAGVKTTASGLQYEVLTEGTGPMPKATDMVKVNYKGTLLNGKVFDTSEGKEPVTFPLNQVIPGWTEGVQLMKEGSKYRFTIPSELAYGESGAGADITPNSTLIFDVELIKVNPPAPAEGK